MRIVSVAGSDPCEERETALAYDVGRLLAERGVAVACGGRGGVMEAACRGAKDGGGTTIGILPGGDTAGSNAYLDLSRSRPDSERAATCWSRTRARG